MPKQKISLIIPAYNEEKNIMPLYNLIKKNLETLDYEIIFINDGSTDKTKNEIFKIKDNKIRLIDFKKNCGKGYAYYVAIKKAKNEIIGTIDADLQDNPKDILILLKKLNEGYDLVCGWRHKRKDTFTKRVSSKIGNFISNRNLKLNIHDNNCPIRVFKKSCFESVNYFKNMHRFLPVLANMQGYKIAEEKVENFPRIHGKSKYGIHNRILGNLRALYLIKFRQNQIIKN